MTRKKNMSRRADRIAALSCAFIFYTYVGYPIVLWLRARRRRMPPEPGADQPRVTVIIAAYNEERTLGETLGSVVASVYAPGRLEVLVVSDGSTDGTDDIVGAFADRGVRLLRRNHRGGQVPAFEAGREAASGEILLFADAGELFRPDTVSRMIRHFADPGVGAVSGSKITRKTGSAVSGGDNLYTRYDAWLRALESRSGSSWVGCEGGIYAIRRSLFRIDFPLDVAADNALCYRLYQKGYRHIFDPSAVVWERPSQNLGNEFSRKVRIIVTQLRGLWFFRRLLRPLRHPDFSFQNISHKLCRWLAPFALVSFFAAGAASKSRMGRLLFRLQAAFYALAAAGGAAGRRRIPRLLSVPAYFTAVNAAGFSAWLQLFRDFTIWQPPAREAVSTSGRTS